MLFHFAQSRIIPVLCLAWKPHGNAKTRGPSCLIHRPASIGMPAWIEASHPAATIPHRLIP